MKKIIINSPKHGRHEILVDDEDFERVNQLKWTIDKRKNNYYVFNQSGRIKLYLHRFIMNETDPNLEIDHKFHNGLDNRKCNLRVCTVSQNQSNRRPSKNGTSKYLGVSWSNDRSKWLSQININKKTINLGRYNSEIEAAKVYDKKAIELFGEFANLNFK